MAVALFHRAFWRESGKSQGFGDRVPSQVPLIAAIRALSGLAVSHSSDILGNAYFLKETLFHDRPIALYSLSKRGNKRLRMIF